MTHKGLAEILYNPGNLNTSNCEPIGADELLERIQPFHFHRENLHRSAATDTAMMIRDADYRILETLEELKAATDPVIMSDALSILKRRLPDASLDVRPHIIREFAIFMETCMDLHSQSKRLFQSCLEILIELKKGLDTRDQSHGNLIKSEWVEMEKSIYRLTIWENQL
jgi:hypothetical protein